MELVQNLQVYSLTYSSLNTEHWFCDESRFVFEKKQNI